MPHNLYWEDNGVYWKYYGKVTGKEVVDTSTSIYGDERFDSLKYKLVDFLDVDNLEMNEDEIALVAFQHRSVERSNPYIKTAIVMPAAGIEMGKKFVSYFSDSFWDVRIFQDLDEANRWLGRTESGR